MRPYTGCAQMLLLWVRGTRHPPSALPVTNRPCSMVEKAPVYMNEKFPNPKGWNAARPTISQPRSRRLDRLTEWQSVNVLLDWACQGRWQQDSSITLAMRPSIIWMTLST